MTGLLIFGIILALIGIFFVPVIKLIFYKKQKIYAQPSVLFLCFIFIILGIILIYISQTGI